MPGEETWIMFGENEIPAKVLSVAGIFREAPAEVVDAEDPGAIPPATMAASEIQVAFDLHHKADLSAIPREVSIVWPDGSVWKGTGGGEISCVPASAPDGQAILRATLPPDISWRFYSSFGAEVCDGHE